MAEAAKSLLIKRYASRRLYNTETSDYVTLEDIAAFIRDGREVQIVDLKSGDDLTRQYLLQIIAEHESRGESVLPVDVLTDLVRSYTTQAQSVVPQFLAASFEMLREGQSKLMENLTALPSPLNSMPGFEAMQRQQQAFLKSIMGGMATAPASEPDKPDPKAKAKQEDLDAIKKQLAELLDMTPKEVANMLKGNGRHVSVDAPLSGEDGDSTMLDVISSDEGMSPDGSLMEQSLKEEVQQGLSILSPREVEVLSSYYGLNGQKSLTLEEIGELYGLTRERVRQIKERAIRRLRKSYNRNALKSYLG